MIYKAFFGLAGAGITLTALILSLKTLRNFKERENVAMSMFYLQESASEFRILAYVALGYSLVAGLVVNGVIPDEKAYDLAVMGLFVGITRFLWHTARITSGAEK